MLQENETSNHEENEKEMHDDNLPKNWKYADSRSQDLIISDSS